MNGNANTKRGILKEYAIIAVITTNKKFNRSLKLKPTPSKKFLTLILTLKNPHKIKLPIIPTEAAVNPIFDLLNIHINPIKAKVIIIKTNFQSKNSKIYSPKNTSLLFYLIKVLIIHLLI